MITKHVINSIYKQFRHRPKNQALLNIEHLFDTALDYLKITVDETQVTIGSLESNSPFRVIPLRRIHGIVKFDSATAIVFHSSIIFLNRHGKGINIHVKQPPKSIWQKIRWWFSRQ